MNYPAMFRLGQRPRCPVLENVPEAVLRELSKLNLAERVKKGSAVAVACGSARIANYAAIIKAVVDHFRELGTTPFIVAAMGGDGNGQPRARLRSCVGWGLLAKSSALRLALRWKRKLSVICRKACPCTATSRLSAPITLWLSPREVAPDFSQRRAEWAAQNASHRSGKRQWSEAHSQGCSRLPLRRACLRGGSQADVKQGKPSCRIDDCGKRAQRDRPRSRRSAVRIYSERKVCAAIFTRSFPRSAIQVR
jgi:hypothetical protein